MARMSKVEWRRHEEAQALVDNGRKLTEEERDVVLRQWLPATSNNVGATGAFFTPPALARELLVEVHGPRGDDSVLVDLCAGIGSLARAALDRWEPRDWSRVVCVEINPDYVAVGKRIVPEAEWLLADMREAEAELTGLNIPQVVSNPPFGNVAGCKRAHYVAAEIAARLGRDGGVFIMPDRAAPWRLSCDGGFRKVDNPDYDRWSAQSGVVLSPNCGIDTRPALAESPFHGTQVGVEICLVERAENVR